ncbi:MAG TPA: 16S rRNA (adenine(1518)-N(6)/adenine(1519)-N(6))-dimethyltransferase RsmA [Blastocatellia bacterium]|nr:16S rRNA (adenine(1518)-N(6)/adenine(1519)-N(6))-dimethyltransferase RsmA [Blastocatellia bacterium]
MIKAKKSLGQNFLADGRISRRIVESVAPLRSDLILEIGPGTGALTTLLVEQSGFVVAVELDPRLIRELENTLARENHLIVEADALTVDWAELIARGRESLRRAQGETGAPERVRVVANLPYYVSTPIIERLLRLKTEVSDMTLMLQNEVADRIASKPGTREYGYLSVLVQFYSEVRKLFEVPPSAFRPAPKVRSAIIRLDVRSKPLVDVASEEGFLKLVSFSFAQRRKTMANNLKAAAGALRYRAPIEEGLHAAGIDPRRRAETLSVAEFGALYRALVEG